MSDIKLIQPDNQTRDYKKFYVDRPDSDFSPERNKAVVERTIKKYEKQRANKRKQYRDAIAERSEVVYDYLSYLDKGGTKPIEKWIGRRELAYLQGRRIMQTVANAKRNLLKLYSK